MALLWNGEVPENVVLLHWCLCRRTYREIGLLTLCCCSKSLLESPSQKQEFLFSGIVQTPGEQNPWHESLPCSEGAFDLCLHSSVRNFARLFGSHQFSALELKKQFVEVNPDRLCPFFLHLSSVALICGPFPTVVGTYALQVSPYWLTCSCLLSPHLKVL